ncbi:MAG: bifunctional methylenetetrahydrofolate dehydrogenase/methenyltetrahydrofolate cyclohydrolase FolD [Planctomycetes bacterium]|nr:bifunctional methylenetetrahydrofolate dehydrogenase/methenyltetrahydrofolate cyclohydrolase FolD [Planctomycetota bacterium]MDP6520424.1 bifunctional methylenetetrahydrofolate dehydrogenase/methenyltetrahydrofolate cyclohydrolase FolD [Planctomycetota bacterium]
MTAIIIDGKATAGAVREELARCVAELKDRGVHPGLAVVLVGEDPASQVYVRNKDRAASEAGLAVSTLRLGADTDQATLLAAVEELNRDEAVHGILVQLPLPEGLDENQVIEAIDPAKDVDGLHPRNVAALTMGRAGLVPCTPAGCIELLDRHGIEIEGRRAVIVGRSMLVGKPLAALLLARHGTVTICHSRTRDLAAVVGEAEIVVAAVGVAGLVKGAWIRPGATVLDVGINRNEAGKLVGDVETAAAAERAGAITPVPGGVGPMTIAMLLRNTIIAAALANGLDAEEILASAAAAR